jgi:TolB-like protein/Flp pilus assembly protein TadD
MLPLLASQHMQATLNDNSGPPRSQPLTLFNELKRRNVIRVGVLYLVAAWLLLQLTDVLSSLLPVPESAGSIVVMLLVLGFFPVLIFSWVYEMTPEGVKREVDVDRSQSITPDTGKKINTLIIVLLVLAIAGLVADRLIPESTVDTDVAAIDADEAPLPADDRSIAVLPFSDLSQDQDQQYFTDGLSEELLNLLVHVDELRVASRTSSFAYRGSTLGVPEISKALNVGHVLEGSVRKDGDRIRITAQLIEAGSDRHLWSENFDREFVDIFAIQSEIANAIVQALTGELGMSSGKAVKVEAATENLDAYEMYLTARELFIKREQLPESIRLFRKAVELDPNFARAWAGLGAVEAVANEWIFGDGIDHQPLAKAAAEKALSLNPELSMPLAVLGLVAAESDDNLIGSLEYHAAAIEKDPKNTSAWLWRGLGQMEAGFIDEAMASLQQCLAIDPGYQNCRQHLARAYLMNGDVETALKLNNETLEHMLHSTSDALVSTYVRNGQRYLALFIADARLGSAGAPVIEWIRAIENPDADNSSGLARLKDWERQTSSGEKLSSVTPMFLSFRAYDELAEIPGMAGYSLWHPDGDEFRTTPQFKTIIRQNGVFEYWQARGFPPHCKPVGDDDFECGRP